MQDRRDKGKEEFGKGGMEERTDVGMQKRRDAGKDGFSKGYMQVRRNAE